MTDIDTMARTMVGEARGEGLIGMQAVANVILNRVSKESWYGLTPTEVCRKPYQFSCWNKNDPNKLIIEALGTDKSIFRDALDIAQKVLDGDLADITHGATHYKVIGTIASWANGKTPCAVIGHHEFYNNIE